MTDVGEIVGSRGIILTDAVRGVQYRFEATVYEDGAAAGTCSATAVQGDPFDARDYQFIRANGRVSGTGQTVPVEAVWVTLGDETTPSRWYFIIARENMELAFDPDVAGSGLDGAMGSIEVTVETGGPSRIEIVLFTGEVFIADSAFGVAT